MGKTATKAADNVYCRARYEAAKFNDRLWSREGASEEMGIDKSRLARIELGSIIPYPEEVLLMADIYNAPELKNGYCRNHCPLGSGFMPVTLENFDRLVIKALSVLNRAAASKAELLAIAEDGNVTKKNMPDIERILDTLDEVTQVSQNLRIWAEKNLK